MPDRIMSVDAGFAACGVAIFELVAEGNMAGGAAEWTPRYLECVRTEADKRDGTYVAQDDMKRMVEMANRLDQLRKFHDCKWLVAEIPGGGGQSARAVRAMSMCSGMLAGFLAATGIGYECFMPWDTRKAAGVPGSVRTGKDVKQIVMANMRKTYPYFAKWECTVTKVDSENVADALACFVCAKNIGQMIGHITPLARRSP